MILDVAGVDNSSDKIYGDLFVHRHADRFSLKWSGKWESATTPHKLRRTLVVVLAQLNTDLVAVVRAIVLESKPSERPWYRK